MIGSSARFSALFSSFRAQQGPPMLAYISAACLALPKCYAAHASTVRAGADTDPSRRVVPVLSNPGDEPRRHPGLGGGGKRVSGVCRHHLLIEKGLVHPPPTLSLPFLRPPIPCWLGGCSSRVAYSKITAARIFLYSAPIGTCRCASSPIGPEIRPRNRRFAPTCALTSSFWHQLSPHPAVGRISLAQCTGTLPMLWDNTPGSLGCPPVPTQDGALSCWSSALSKRSVLMRFEHDAGETTGNQDWNWASAGPGVPWGCLLKILVASCGLAHQ